MPQIRLNLDRQEKELVFGLLDYIKTDIPCAAKYKKQFLQNLFLQNNQAFSRTLLFPYVVCDGHYLDLEFVQLQIIDPYDFIYSPTSLCAFLNHLGALNIRGKYCTYNQVGKWKLLNYYNRVFGMSLTEKVAHENRMKFLLNNGLRESMKELLSICTLKPDKDLGWGD